MDNVRQKGQALLIVVLVIVVSLTVGLGVVSRSVTNLRTSTEEENSQRAFSAAEAGIEQAIKTGCITPVPPATGCTSFTGSFTAENKASFSTSVTSLSGTDFLVNGGNLVEADDGADVWLVPRKTDGTGTPDYSKPWTGSSLTFYWGTSSDVCDPNPLKNTMAALEIIVISGPKSNPTSSRSVFDPCSARQPRNQFPASSTGGTLGSTGVSFPYKAQISIPSNGLIARAIPLYYSTTIGVLGDASLPSQGNQISSTGLSGQTNRKISFYQGYPELPSEFFQYVLFSPR